MLKDGLKIALVATALTVTGACATQKPKVLPPAPGSTTTPSSESPVTGASTETDPNAGAGAVGQATLSGSRADFLQSVSADRIFFQTDEFSIDGEDRSVLDTHAAWLTRNSNVRVTIEGHADERGTREYNLALADRRANAAKNYLVSRGVDAGRINVISWGKERPAQLGSDESAWAQNRRAVTVLPQ